MTAPYRHVPRPKRKAEVVLKWPGKCSRCQATIPAGTKALYSDAGVEHRLSDYCRPDPGVR